MTIDLKAGKTLLEEAKAKYPQARWSLSKDGAILAYYEPSLGRFVAVAMTTITGHWAQLKTEILCNGKLPYTDADFEGGL